MSSRLYIYDCLSEKLRVAGAPFMTIGRGEGNVFRCKMRAISGGSFALGGAVCRFVPHSSVGSYSLNGQRLQRETVLSAGILNLLVLEGGCLVVWFGDERQMPNFSTFAPREWYTYDKASRTWSGPMSLENLYAIPEGRDSGTLAVFKGLTSCAFELADVREVARFTLEEAGALPRKTQPSVGYPAPAEENDKVICCPHCWQRFPLSHALAISSHPKLVGDRILGQDAQQRFTPVQVNQQGVPVDAMGMSVREYACPWCHHKMPPFFSRSRQMIFSLIGVPGAGKSYYLTTMLHELEYTLPREFGLAFRDADSRNNAPLNAMRMRLFSANAPEEAWLERTDTHGPLYHEIWRDEHYVRVPRPLTYSLSSPVGKTCTLVFYDTAGANGEAGADAQERVPAHIEVASAIFFLFDPTVDLAFRRLIDTDRKSTGEERPLRGRQALLLSEMEMRLRAVLHLPPEQKLAVPLAIIVGKSDTWQHLLGTEPMLPSVRSGQFQPKFVDVNSKRLRQFLFNVTPSFCTNAEAISTNVRYFAAGAFGNKPEEFTDSQGVTHLVPSGGTMHPNRVIDPILWALHCKDPELLCGSRP